MPRKRGNVQMKSREFRSERRNKRFKFLTLVILTVYTVQKGKIRIIRGIKIKTKGVQIRYKRPKISTAIQKARH